MEQAVVGCKFMNTRNGGRKIGCRDPHNSEHLFATCRTCRLTGYRLMHGFGLYTGIRSTVN